MKTQLELSVQHEDGMIPESIAFSANAYVLAVAYSNGRISLLDPLTLTLLHPQAAYRY